MNQPKISKNNYIAQRRYVFWKRDPHCHWCGKKLKWKKSTIDHINQRTKLGDEKRPRIGRLVLSCEPCNNQRQIDAFNEMNKVQQWIRDNNIPPIRRVWGKRSTPLYARAWLLYYYLKLNLKWRNVYE